MRPRAGMNESRENHGSELLDVGIIMDDPVVVPAMPEVGLELCVEIGEEIARPVGNGRLEAMWTGPEQREARRVLRWLAMARWLERRGLSAEELHSLSAGLEPAERWLFREEALAADGWMLDGDGRFWPGSGENGA